MNNIYLSFRITCLLFLIIIVSCSPTEPVFKNHDLTLTVDAEVTETWINLQVSHVKKSATYFILRDTTVIFEGRLDKADTLIHDEYLEPSTAYNYSAYAKKGGNESKMVEVPITTMDTTGHDFTWELLTFGNHSPSTLDDVVIVNENDIWAVGEILIDDSTYNAIHWDGNEWELLQIPVRVFEFTTVAPIYGVYVSNKNSLWFTTGASLVHWDGSLFKTVVFLEDYLKSDNYSPLRRIWALDESNIYLTSTQGNVIYWNGRDYKELSQITQASINDLWASKISSKPNVIYGAVSNKYSDSEYFIMKLEGETVGEAFNWRKTSESVFSLWFNDLNKIFAIGTDLTDQYDYHIFTRDRRGNWKDFENPVDKYFLHAVRGNDINDLFICGDFLVVAHYNGKTWRSFDSLIQPAAFYRMDYKDDVMVAVGITATRAVLLMMKRK